MRVKWSPNTKLNGRCPSCNNDRIEQLPRTTMATRWRCRQCDNQTYVTEFYVYDDQIIRAYHGSIDEWREYWEIVILGAIEEKLRKHDDQ
jgi:hypothetical protein